MICSIWKMSYIIWGETEEQRGEWSRKTSCNLLVLNIFLIENNRETIRYEHWISFRSTDILPLHFTLHQMPMLLGNEKLICRKMSDISILYEFSLICSSFRCPQNYENEGVLFRDLCHASQIYSDFTDFLFRILILSQACNEITWHCSKHDFCIIIAIDLPPLTGAAWHFLSVAYQFLLVPGQLG